MGATALERLQYRVGRQAGDPRVAAAVVGATAVVFTTAWVLVVSRSSAAFGGEPPLGWVVLGATCVGNAGLTAWVVWTLRDRLDAERLTAGRGGVLGLAVGVLSYPLLGVTVTGTSLLLTLFGVTPFPVSPGDLVGTVVLVGVGSVFVTLGIPLLLSVAAGAWIGHCRRRYLRALARDLRRLGR